MMTPMNAAPPSFLDSRDFSRIARSIRYIDAHYREQPRLAQIAADAGLSEFHFNRLFRRWAGLTPKQYLGFVTGNAAKTVLAEQPSVLEAAYRVGLSGPGRLHDLVVALEAMTPGELKLHGRGVLIRYGFTDTPFGRALIGVTDRGVCHLSFVEPGKDPLAFRELEVRWPEARLQPDDAQVRSTAEHIWGSVPTEAAPLSVAVAGTNFQLKVWQALIDLGSRGTTTYADLAAAIGSPSASRAVGNAVGANPVAWLIPCHRVLRRDGALGGYHWGADRKRAMLAWGTLCHLPAGSGQGRVNRGLGT
jgi:AraC family transcriptional regulator of adaptative response/methylated-DNA-[protein]-cysteine methyltransferase